MLMKASSFTIRRQAMNIVMIEENRTHRAISKYEWSKLQNAIRGLNFIGQNPQREDWQRMSGELRGALLRRVEKANRQWINSALSALEAAWIKVLDGRIIQASKHSCTQPDYPALFKESEKRPFKVPFVFVSETLFVIEESKRCAA